MTRKRIFPGLTLLAIIVGVLLLTMTMLKLVQAQGSVAITIVKSPDSQMVVSGSAATFTIAVTNSGDVTLTNVIVSDALTPNCDQGVPDLAPGLGHSYTCSTASLTSDFTNMATVTGTDTLSATNVTSSDTAFVDVINPGIQIIKTADTPMIVSGSVATFTIDIVNSGDVTLTNVTVTDAQAPNCDRLFSSLAATDSQSYQCSLLGMTGDFTNAIMVSGSPPVGNDVTASDTAFVDVINPGLQVAKTPDTQIVVSGTVAVFTITITNSGDITLTNVTVTDALVPACDAGPVDLAPQQIVSGTCSVTAAADLTNSVIVTGSPPVGDDVIASDSAFVDVISPEIEISKMPDMQMVSSGSAANFTITITNTGDIILTNVTVLDAAVPSCDMTFASLPAGGGSASYSCSENNVQDGFINSAIVSGSLPEGQSITAADAARVRLDETQTCPSDMLAYWRLGEAGGSNYDDYYDGHDALCAGGCPVQTSGHASGEYGQLFNGYDTGLDSPAVPGDDSFNWGENDSFSIEFWMQTHSASTCSSTEVVAGRDDSATDLHWWVGCQGGTGRAAFYLSDTDGTVASVVGTTDLSDGEWHYVVAVRDAGADEIRIYVDGAEQDAVTAIYSAGFDSSTAALNIGWLNLSPYYHFNGSLDELSLYSRVLTADEIRQHHNEGLAGRWYCQSGVYAPIIVSVPVTEATVGRLYTYDVEAAGDPSPTYALIANPDGMSIDPATGLISWMPALIQEGNHAVLVQASNSEGTDTQNYNIFVAEGTICPSDMIAYWKLDETAASTYDDFYNGYNGTCAGDCPGPAAGRINGGQVFSNTTGIDVPADPWANAAFDWAVGDSFSIEFWMQTESASTCAGTQVVIGRDEASSNLHWWAGCQNNTGRATFYLGDTGGSLASVVGSTDLTDGNWHHVVAMRDASANEIRIYVDGSEENATTVTYGAGFGSSTAAVNIGWLHLSGGYHFDGLVDEVALYNRALSLGEIQQHHSEPGPGYCINPEIAIAKTADPAVAYPSDTVIYYYDVTNPGDASLSGVTLADDKCSSVSFVSGDDNSDNKLDTSETWRYNCSISVSADITNTVMVTGTHSLSGTVNDQDTLFVDVISPHISVDKTASSELVYAGDIVTYTYTLTNPGDDPLSGLTLNDDKCSPLLSEGGDDNINSLLDPDETWIYGCSMQVSADITNTVTITATDSAGGTVNAQDQLFVDVRDSAITILKQANDDLTSFGFTLSYDSTVEPFQLRNNHNEQFTALAPGSYTIAETVIAEWELIDIVCDNGLSVTTPDPAQITFDLQSGQDVSCTFTNYNIGLEDPYPNKIYLPLVLRY